MGFSPANICILCVGTSIRIAINRTSLSHTFGLKTGAFKYQYVISDYSFRIKESMDYEIKYKLSKPVFYLNIHMALIMMLWDQIFLVYQTYKHGKTNTQISVAVSTSQEITLFHSKKIYSHWTPWMKETHTYSFHIWGDLKLMTIYNQ